MEHGGPPASGAIRHHGRLGLTVALGAAILVLTASPTHGLSGGVSPGAVAGGAGGPETIVTATDGRRPEVPHGITGEDTLPGTATTIPTGSTTTTDTLVPAHLGLEGTGGPGFPWVVAGLVVLMVVLAMAVVSELSGLHPRVAVRRWWLIRVASRRGRLGPLRSARAWWRARSDTDRLQPSAPAPEEGHDRPTPRDEHD